MTRPRRELWWRTALCAVAVLASGLSSARASEPSGTPIAKGQRVFSAGHSFHFLNYSFPELLRSVAVSAGYPDHQITGTSVIFGSQVIAHWNIPDADNKVKAALEAGDVDVLTVTPIYLPDDGIGNFARLGLQYNPNFRETVQEFWLPYDNYQPHNYEPPIIPPPANVDHNLPTGRELRAMHTPYFREMDDAVRSINKKLGKQVVFVVPVGQAVIALREKIIAGQAPGLNSQSDLFADNLGHPTAPLQVLLAYCHFAVIYRKSPIGLPVPQILANSRIPSGDLDALNNLLQRLAWDAVIHNRLSGVTAS